MISLGSCNADGCPGEVLVEREVGGIREAVCTLCGTEYAAPVKAAKPEPEKDWTEEPDRWWDR